MTTDSIRIIKLPPEEVRVDLVDRVTDELRKSLPKEVSDEDITYAAQRICQITRPDLFE
jgi:hypothetical protein